MKKRIFIVLGIWCALYLLPAITHAQDKTAEKSQLYIGIAKNRLPYTYLDKDKQPKGILVEKLNTLCARINATCEYVSGEFDHLLEELQTFRIHGLVVIDSFVAPEIDHIKLTTPLCQIEPVYILPQGTNRQKPEDFKGTTIGVGYGSLSHLYLLDEYSSLARIRPYPTLESGVFDLTTGRIGALFTDKAFFQARVANTALVSQSNPTRLIILNIGKPELPATSMTLAVRERDQELLDDMERVLGGNGNPPPCSSLLTQPPEQTTPKPAKPESPDTEKPARND